MQLEEINDIFSEITVINRTENRFQGAFKLYAVTKSEARASINIVQKRETTQESYISIRVQKEKDIKSSIRITYADTSDMIGTIQTVSNIDFPCFIEVPIHNRFQGSFTLLSAPVKTVALSPISDAMTRSREDLRSINYGDLRTMLIGKVTDESYQSFLQFGDLKKSIPDLNIIKKAKLRLYYSGTTLENANIKLSQPNTFWYEMGITDLNKPHSTEILNDTDYVINIKEKYIEFDFFDVVKRWQDNELDNNGLIISTEDDIFYTLFTRESNKPPKLIVEYITTEVYSTGRSDKWGTVFVYGKGHKDLSAKINVHSDIGFDWRKATIYVHRYEDPVEHNMNATITVSKPSLKSTMFIKIRKESEQEATIRVTNQKYEFYKSDLTINRPDLTSVIEIYGNSFMNSAITIRRQEANFVDAKMNVNQPDLVSSLEVSIYKKISDYIDSAITIRTGEKYSDIVSKVITNHPDLKSSIDVYGNTFLSSIISIRSPIKERTFDAHTIVSHPDIRSFIEVSPYRKVSSNINGHISVRTEEQYEDIESNIVINRPHTEGFIKVRGIKDSYLSSIIDVMQNTNQDALITINRPDLTSSITVKEFKDLASTIYIRYQSDVNATIDIKQISEITGTINIKQFIELLGEISVNSPDVEGILNVRVQGEKNLESVLMVKKRFVSDMNSIITISGGSRNRNMIIMF